MNCFWVRGVTAIAYIIGCYVSDGGFLYLLVCDLVYCKMHHLCESVLFHLHSFIKILFMNVG